jgi:hypothetical protein
MGHLYISTLIWTPNHIRPSSQVQDAVKKHIHECATHNATRVIEDDPRSNIAIATYKFKQPLTHTSIRMGQQLVHIDIHWQ